MKQASQRGGFAAQNSGDITDCYSLVEVRGGGSAGGFIGSNSGRLIRCYASSKIKGLSGGFIAEHGGKLTNCYFLYDAKKGAAELKQLSDAALSQDRNGLDNESDAAQLGFDMQKVWALGSKTAALTFEPESWMYDIRASAIYAERASRKTVTINNAEELYRFAKMVNDGNEHARNAIAALAADIDLGGKPWEPIGRDRTCAFCGLFDGGGYTVKNFTMSAKQGDNLGFFGVLKGEVYNLSIDCRIKDGVCVGAFAAQCAGGVIGCCSAAAELSGRAGAAGGFVGNNSGTVFRCYCAGSISKVRLLFPLLIGNGILAAAVLILAVLPDSAPEAPVYAPVPYDEDAVPIEEEQGEEITPRTDTNFVSFQFEQNIIVDRATGLCKFDFMNPGDSNHNTVVQLQFTDAQAVRIMGSTGRSAQEQARLESDPNYDPELSRMVLAESGSIPPGYELTDLKLIEQENGATLPAGEYNAMVYLMFYDMNTNARAMLESQLPVVITVQ